MPPPEGFRIVSSYGETVNTIESYIVARPGLFVKIGSKHETIDVYSLQPGRRQVERLQGAQIEPQI